MSCGNCSQTDGELRAEAWIQPCVGEQAHFSNSIDGDYPAINFSNLKPGRTGKKTRKYKKDSRNGNWVMCTITTDAPTDGTVDVEIAACGCGGYVPRELEDDLFNVFMNYYCCDSLVYTQVITGIYLGDPTFDKLNDFDNALDKKVSYSATINSEFHLFPLAFSEVAASTGISTGTAVRDVAYVGATSGCSGGCGKGCIDRWVAVTDDGIVIYKADKTAGVASVAIPGYSGNAGNGLIAERKGKVYVSYSNATSSGYWYATLDANGAPGAWTQVVTGVANVAMHNMLATDNGVVLQANEPGGITIIYTIVNGGQYTSVNAYSTPLIRMDVCGKLAVAGAFSGAVVVNNCGAWTATPVAPGTNPAVAVAIQPSTGDYWVGDNTGAVHKSTDGGYSWQSVGLPSATAYISGIQWANALVGYIISAGPAKVFATTDGGATWQDSTDRIAGPVANGTTLWAAAVPCCDNPTSAANSLLIGGVTTAGRGGVWLGSKQVC